MEFRSDINGLRALAVISVLLFHAGFTAFSGGFVGVDIFFVISGFLMTGIIYTGVKKDKFSVTNFWLARAKRIIPALFALLCVLITLGFFYMVPNDFKILGANSFHSIIFHSNHFYARNLGYFEKGGDINWLLHTWSLSVEWQFYMIFPFIVMAFTKFKNGKYLVPLLAIMAVISYALSAYLTQSQPKQSFFFLHTRFYEFVLGGLVFLLSSYKTKNKYLFEIGLAFVLLSVFTYNEALSFPGIYSLLPALGAALMIRAEKNSFMLSNPISQFVGKISYSVYLWHFPLICVLKYLEIEITFELRLALIVASILFGWLSYKLVEQPSRKVKLDKEKWQLCLKLTSVLIIAAVIFQVPVWTKGLPSRLPADIEKVAGQFVYKFDKERKKCGEKAGECIVGNQSIAPSIALWGDSHALSTVKALDELVDEANKSMSLYIFVSCPSLKGVINPVAERTQRCYDFSIKAYDSIASSKSIKDVFMVNRWGFYLLGGAFMHNGVQAPLVVFDKNVNPADFDKRYSDFKKAIIDTSCGLAKAGKKVHILQTVPEMPKDVQDAMTKSFILKGAPDHISITRKEYEERNKLIVKAFSEAQKKCGVDLIDPTKYLCDKYACHADMNGMPIYNDSNHLNIFGDDLIKPAFAKIILGH